MAGHRITGVETRRDRLRGPLPAGFAARITGQTVVKVRRRAKYLVVELSGGDLLIIHLGMTGSFRVHSTGAHSASGTSGDGRSATGAHDHVVFDLSTGARVVFNDPRRFGSMALVPAAGADASGPFQGLGPEPLTRGFSASDLARSLRGRRTSIKAALLDQRVVAGLGNIYAAEALHHAGIAPARRAGSLVTRDGQPHAELIALTDAIRVVLRRALRRKASYGGGNDRFRVYDREGLRCLRPGCRGVIERTMQAGRSTFWCRRCQLRRGRPLHRR
jgi:formamidopyrimidine-DNA glycosylase